MCFNIPDKYGTFMYITVFQRGAPRNSGSEESDGSDGTADSDTETVTNRITRRSAGKIKKLETITSAI